MNVALVGADGNDNLSFRSDSISTPLQLTMAGGAGNDVAQADFGLPFAAGNVENVNVGVYFTMGDGDDTARANLWGVVRGTAEFSLRMEGDAGNDALRFYNDNGSHAGAKVSAILNGGAGNDTLSLFFDDDIIGTYRFLLDGGAGNDRVEATLNVRNGSTGSLDVMALGESGRDAMRLDLNDQSGGRLRLLRALLDGGADPDTLVSATPNVQVINIP
jgi:hypothetical protein